MRRKVYFIILMGLQETVKNRRKELQISQNDLAEISGVSIATIKNIERGKGNPSFDTVLRIIDVLGLEIVFNVRSPFDNK